MARVPYEGVPEEQPETRVPEDYLQAAAPPQAFGEQVGQALQTAGDKLMQTAEFYNKVAADHATNNFVEQTRALVFGDPSKGQATDADGQPIKSPSGSTVYQDGFYSLRGRDALDAYPEINQKLEDLRQEQLSGLHTAASQLEFDTESRRYLNETLNEMGRQATEQKKVWAQETAANSISLGQNAVAADLANPDALAQDREDLRNAYAKMDQAKFGFSPEIQQGSVLKADQAFYTTQIRAALGNNDPDRAQKALSESGSILASTPQYDELARQVRAAAFDKTSVTLSDQATQEALAEAAAASRASVGAGGGPGTSTAPAPTGPIYDQIAKSAAAHGATPAETSFLQREAFIESRGNPNAINGRSKGLFQFHDETFAGLGGTDIHDTDQQTAAALRGAQQNSRLLTQAGVPVTDGNLYLMHQQGPAGGRALLTAAPETNAIQALAPAYGGNAVVATQAITRNGGTANMTAGQFVSMWQDRFGGGAGAGANTGATSSVADYLLMNKARLMADFRTRTEAAFPNDPYHQEQALQKYDRNLGQVISQQEDQYKADTHMVMIAAEGATSFGQVRTNLGQHADALDRLAVENPYAYNSLSNRFDVESKGKAEEFGTNFSSYLSRALAPTTDPNRITNPMQLNPFLGAGKDAALTTAGQKALADITGIRGTPQGEAFATQARNFLAQMHGDLTFSSQPAGRFDPKGEKAFSAYAAVALPIMVSAYKNGTLGAVLNPNSPDYLGKLAQPFMRTPAEIIKDRLDLNYADRATLDEKIFDSATLGRNFLQSQVKAGRMSQAEAIRIGEDYGWFSRPGPSGPPPAATPPGWRPGHPPPTSALPPLVR